MPILDHQKILPVTALIFIALTLGPAGCGTKGPPLSPQAAAFKKEVREIINKLTAVVAGPLSQDDGKAGEQAVLSAYPAAGQDTDEFPFRLGLLDENGILLGTVPPVPAQEAGVNFSSYELTKTALDKKRLAKARLYAPDGAPVYIIMAPVTAANKVEGLLALRITAAQAEKKWGITEKEFLEMDLN